MIDNRIGTYAARENTRSPVSCFGTQWMALVAEAALTAGCASSNEFPLVKAWITITGKKQ